MNTTLARRKLKKMVDQLPQPKSKSIWPLVLGVLAIVVGVKMFPEMRRYWRIKRM
jgi:hypothetical protein